MLAVSRENKGGSCWENLSWQGCVHTGLTAPTKHQLQVEAEKDKRERWLSARSEVGAWVLCSGVTDTAWLLATELISHAPSASNQANPGGWLSFGQVRMVIMPTDHNVLLTLV